jgi:hypothetical protein
MLVQVTDAACHDFETSLQFVAVEVDEVSHVGDVVGRDISEQLAVIVVFVVLEDSSSIKPGEIIDNFED